MIQNACVFCGSSLGARTAYADAARQMGYELAQHNIGLVYGGGSTGLMGLIADSALKHGGRVIGIIPQALKSREVEHRALSELHVVATMHERKAMMADRADAFIALPGGFGTYEELFEIITWAQLGLHRKPILVLNIQGYFEPLLRIVEHGVQEGFIRSIDPDIIMYTADVGQVVPLLRRHPTQDIRPKWMGPDQT